jgi:DNA polymerase-1
VEALYERLEEVPQKGAREKLRAGRESAVMSKKLVTIETAVPLSIDFHRLQSAPPDTPRLLRLFDQLEFRSLAARLRELAVRAPSSPGTQTDAFSPAAAEEPSTAPPAAAPRADITSDEHRYRLVTDVAELQELVRALASAPILVVDTETTSTNAMQADLLGVSLCAKEREAFYIPVAPPDGSPWEGRGIAAEAALAALRPLLEDPAVPKAGQNIEYDALVLKAHGVELSGIAFDTMVASYVLRADGQHGLDALAMEHFGYRMVSFEDLTGKGKAQIPLTEVPLERLADYSCEDADMTMRIMGAQRGKLHAMGLEDLCSRVEFPLIPVIVAMEAAGVAVDTGHLAGMSRELEVQISALVARVHELAGTPFNINSTQQLADVLFNRLGLPPVRKTKTGFSTDVNVLESLRHAHPVVDAMLEYRQLAKLKSTYVDALPGLINPRTGRVHASFNQTVAATGRLSSSDPNLQNIPIRTELGRAIRKAFVPGAPGWLLLSADYSQIELRVMAHVCDDPGLKEAFLRGEDIHATTAARVFGVAQGEVTPAMRRKAKEVNFGIMYGIGPFGLGNRLEISQAEARGIIERYFERFPGVHRYIEETKAAARRDGYVSTLLGRRRYLPDIGSRNQNLRGNAERQAINMPIQGTAADMIKLAMVRLHDDLARGGKKSRMILQVHDELVFEVPEGEAEEMRELVARRMREALELSVPVVVDVGAGRNWLEAH